MYVYYTDSRREITTTIKRGVGLGRKGVYLTEKPVTVKCDESYLLTVLSNFSNQEEGLAYNLSRCWITIMSEVIASKPLPMTV